MQTIYTRADTADRSRKWIFLCTERNVECAPIPWWTFFRISIHQIYYNKSLLFTYIHKFLIYNHCLHFIYQLHLKDLSFIFNLDSCFFWRILFQIRERYHSLPRMHYYIFHFICIGLVYWRTFTSNYSVHLDVLRQTY